MIRYRQYRPAFFEGFDSQEGLAEDTQDLLENVDFIANFREHPAFHRFSLSCHGDHPPFNLMVELNEGREWWVVALLWPDYVSEIALPDWKPID